jgi:hypothetical protein
MALHPTTLRYNVVRVAIAAWAGTPAGVWVQKWLPA